MNTAMLLHKEPSQQLFLIRRPREVDTPLEFLPINSPPESNCYLLETVTTITVSKGHQVTNIVGRILQQKESLVVIKELQDAKTLKTVLKKAKDYMKGML